MISSVPPSLDLVGMLTGLDESETFSDEELIPVRMLNEFTYCPRLAYLEWVQGEFSDNLDTRQGTFGHRNVDKPPARSAKRQVTSNAELGARKSERDSIPSSSGEQAGALSLSHPPSTLSPQHSALGQEFLSTRSLTLSAPREGLVAKLDVLELEGIVATPVEYKKGAIPSNPEQAWEPERVQLCAQGLILRENGYTCERGELYYIESRHRVSVPFDDALVMRTRQLLRRLREMGKSGQMPPPLVDSPKCPRCSLVGICLPDETNLLRLGGWPLLAVDVGTTPSPGSECVSAELAPWSEEPDYLVSNTLEDGHSWPSGDCEEEEANSQTGRSAHPPGSRSQHDVPSLGHQALAVSADSQSEDGHSLPSGICEGDGANSRTGRSAHPPSHTPRRLLPARDDALPLYVKDQGAYIGKDGERLTVRGRDAKPVSVPLMSVSQVSLIGNVQISSQALREVVDRGIPVCYFTYGGWLQAMTIGHDHKNIELRIAQFEAAADAATSLRLAKGFITAKIRNCRTILRRHASDKHQRDLDQLAEWIEKADRAESAETLLGLEGMAAKVYFGGFARLLKGGEAFDLLGRNRRPPRDPVNALLSFVYALLVKEITIAVRVVGFDPLLGFFHVPRYGRPSLALDLAEEFRPIIGDSVVMTLINNGEVSSSSFLARAGAVALTDSGRKSVIAAFERRMEQEITHPIFGYKISYRRILEVQSRLLSRVVLGELSTYPGFCTR